MRKIMLIALWSSCVFSAVSSTRVLDSLLTVYDYEVSRSAQIIDNRRSHIDSLRRSGASEEVLLRVGKEYSSFQSDSARACYSRLLTAPEPLCSEARIELIQVYQQVGIYIDGMTLAEEVGVVPEHLRVRWYDVMHRLYSGAASQSTLPVNRERWLQLASQYEDLLIEELKKNTWK